MEWKYKKYYLSSGDFRIYENVYLGNRVDYSLYHSDGCIFTGSLEYCKKQAMRLIKQQNINI